MKPVILDQNEVQFRAGPWSGPTFSIEDEDEDNILADLVQSLDGSRTVDRLLEEFAAHEGAVTGLLTELYEQNIVVEAGSVEREQVGWNVFRSQMNDQTFDEQASQAEVLVLSDRGVGKHVLNDLQNAGIGRIGVSSLNREETTATTNEAVEQYQDPYDGLAAFDNAVCVAGDGATSELQAINERAHANDTSVVFGCVVGYDGVIGPTVVPGQTACYDCFEQRTKERISADDTYEQFKNQLATRRSESVASAFARVVSGYITLEAIHLLIDESPLLFDKIVTVDFTDFTFEPNAVLKVPNCETCKPEVHQQTDWQRFASELRFGSRGSE